MIRNCSGNIVVVAADVLGLLSSMWFIGVQLREMFWLQELRADSVD